MAKDYYQILEVEKSASESEIKKQLDLSGAKYSVHSYDEISDIVASDLADSNAIGWFCGRAEFGPRALGSRSILADPRDKKMQKEV